MKKILFLLLTVISIAACSTSDDSINEEEANLQFEKSLALRINLETIRDRAINTQAKGANDLCFNFEYPINVGYNDGSEITVTDFDSLLELLLQETVESHITEIAFPFNVILADDTVQTITDETEFQTLIDDCGYDFITVAEVLAVVDDCFTINYPLTLVVNDEPQTFNSQEEAEAFFTNNNQDIVSVTFSYPFSVTLIDDTTPTIINDDFELINLITNTCSVN